jgi:hypothetical protein
MESGHIAVLNRIVRVDLTGKVTFKQKLGEVREGASCMSGWRLIQSQGHVAEVVPAFSEWQGGQSD